MTQPPDDDRYMTPGEAADYLGFSPRTITRWAKKGWIRHVLTLGGQHRFLQSDIEDVERRMLEGGFGWKM